MEWDADLGRVSGPKWEGARVEVGLRLGRALRLPVQNPLRPRPGKESVLPVCQGRREQARPVWTIQALPAFSGIAGEVDAAVLHGKDEEVRGEEGRSGGGGRQ